LVVVGLGGYVAGSVESRVAFADTVSTYSDLAVFGEVLGLLQTRYVEPVDDQTLVHGAIRGMLEELDPHTVFLDPQQLRSMRDDTRGEYVGVGLMIRVIDDAIVVTEVLNGGPSRDAGVRADDRIIAVDDVATTGLEVGDVVGMLRGPRGERVILTLERLEPGSEERVEITIPVIRDIVHTEAVLADMPIAGIAHVRVRMFQTNTGGELRSALDRLQADFGAPLEGVVLDLRDNPGGLLSEAISVSDAFLSEGTIVSTGGRLDADETVSEANRGSTRFHGPMTVLINGGSASASEIVAGALQDHGRATLVGTQSYGKGSVQTIIDLQDGSGLKLTISRYYTPSGRSIDGSGIAPDHEVSQMAPLSDDTTEAAPAVDPRVASIDDPQLRAALELLLQP
jgi:carboxyl-terminal processing protease